MCNCWRCRSGSICKYEENKTLQTQIKGLKEALEKCDRYFKEGYYLHIRPVVKDYETMEIDFGQWRCDKGYSEMWDVIKQAIDDLEKLDG